MNEQRHILLSSKRSFLMMYVALVTCVLFIPVMFLAVAETGLHIGSILGLVIYLFAIFVLYVIFSTACEARVIGDTLELKRFSDKTKTFTFDQIGVVSSTTMSRTRYTNLEIILENGTKDFYLIANNTSLPYDEPERILKELNPNTNRINNEPNL